MENSRIAAAHDAYPCPHCGHKFTYAGAKRVGHRRYCPACKYQVVWSCSLYGQRYVWEVPIETKLA
jgi:DNA-directed RNA polymerase subunit RPC12/RpoP